MKEPAVHTDGKEKAETAMVIGIKVTEVYKRNTGKISKKEAKSIAARNKSMKDWVSKMITPTKPRVTDTEQCDL